MTAGIIVLDGAGVLMAGVDETARRAVWRELMTESRDWTYQWLARDLGDLPMTEPREPDTAPDVTNDEVVEPEAPPIVINTPSVTVHEDDDTEDPQP